MKIDVNGKKVVLTGALVQMTRAKATEALEDRGATVTKSVTSKTEILFIGDRPGSKLEKAEGYGIPIYNETQLMAVLGQEPIIVETVNSVTKATVLQEIEDGDSVEVQGSGKDPYILKNVGGVYSCNCMAWRNQSLAIDKRTCKHLAQIRGEEAEAERVGGEVTIRRKAKGSDKPKILLAKKWEEHVDPTGWWMSEKLDGVRAYWTGETFFSRAGNEYLAPEWFTEGLPSTPLDGELWIGRGKFQTTVSIVRRQDRGDAWKDVKFVIFDAPEFEGKFEERYDHFFGAFPPDGHPYATALLHEICTGHEHLTEELERVESLKGEGLMLRQAKSKYATSRSSTLLKVKTFHDAEAKVEGYMGGSGKHRDRVGSLKLITPSGVRFSCGSGLSDAQREAPPAIGSIVTYRFQELTDAGIPRFPTFVAERPDFEWPTSDALESRPKVGKKDGVEVKAAKAKKATKTAVKKPAKKKVAAKETTETEVSGTGENRRLEFVGGTSSKFWEVTVTDASHTVCYGRIGTNGSSKTKDFADNAAAQKDADKLVRQKEKKGYEAVYPSPYASTNWIEKAPLEADSHNYD